MQEKNYPIKSWAKTERPREKLLLQGSGNLTDSELLAILLGNGTREKSALDLAREVLALGKNNLRELGKKSVHDFMCIKGIGEAKAICLAAAFELARRRAGSPVLEKPQIKNSRDIAQYLQEHLQDKNHEVFVAIFLSKSNRVISMETISTGGITSTIVDPRLILKKAVQVDAVGIILCHNHPSGNLKPSYSDESITLRIKEASRLLDIRILDHIIVSENGYFSFADSGIL